MKEFDEFKSALHKIKQDEIAHGVNMKNRKCVIDTGQNLKLFAYCNKNKINKILGYELIWL